MTIVNPAYGFVFVHIPKTGGTSIKDHLYSYGRDTSICIQRTRDAEQLRATTGTTLNKHSTAAQIRDVVGHQQFDAFFKFSITRNPYSRTVSIFHFLKYNFRAWPNSAIMDRFETLEHFVTSKFFRRPGPGRIFEPQFRWLIGDDGQTCMDFIGRSETLETDIAHIREKLNLPLPAPPLRRRNVSKTFLAPPEADKITPLVACAILERYADDFRLFGYAPDSDTALMMRRI